MRHCFEFCSGPGFIGFSLLAHGLCQRLTLADINGEAVAACRSTIAHNNLNDVVTVYESDCLDSIPATEQWDLVVGNPPHWPGTADEYRQNIRKSDPGLVIHKKFYRDVGKFLRPRGSVLLQENGQATSPNDFSSMIADGGLQLQRVLTARPLTVWEALTKDWHVRSNVLKSGVKNKDVF